MKFSINNLWIFDNYEQAIVIATEVRLSYRSLNDFIETDMAARAVLFTEGHYIIVRILHNQFEVLTKNRGWSIPIMASPIHRKNINSHGMG